MDEATGQGGEGAVVDEVLGTTELSPLWTLAMCCGDGGRGHGTRRRHHHREQGCGDGRVTSVVDADNGLLGWGHLRG